MCVDCSVVAEEIVSPNVREKFISGEGDVLVFNKIKEQIVFLRSKFNFLSINGDGSCGNIYFKTIKLQGLLRRCSGSLYSG